MSRLFVVRHGNTFAPGEPPRRIGAGTDLPLVASGVAQAQALGRHFADRGLGFIRALSAPLLRTRQTAGLILADAVAAPPVESADWLAEIDHGPDENRPETAVLARIGREALDAWDRAGVPPPGWIVDTATRIATWQALLSAPPPGDTLLVTSNGAARFALFARPELQPAGLLKLRTGAYAELAFGGSSVNLVAWDVRP